MQVKEEPSGDGIERSARMISCNKGGDTIVVDMVIGSSEEEDAAEENLPNLSRQSEIDMFDGTEDVNLCSPVNYVDDGSVADALSAQGSPILGSKAITKEVVPGAW